MKLGCLLLAVTGLLLGAGAPSSGQQDELQQLRRELERARVEREQLRAEKQREIQELRQRMIRADDMAIDMARKFDQDKRRLQEENEALRVQVARLERDNALLQARLESLQAKTGDPKPPEKDPELAVLSRKVVLNFPDTELTEVAQFLMDITGVTVVAGASVPVGARVTLRVRDLTLRQALDLLCESTRTASGEACPLMWRVHSGAIQIARKKPAERD